MKGALLKPGEILIAKCVEYTIGEMQGLTTDVLK